MFIVLVYIESKLFFHFLDHKLLLVHLVQLCKASIYSIEKKYFNFLHHQLFFFGILRENLKQLFCLLCGVSNYDLNFGELSPLLNYYMTFVCMPYGIVNICITIKQAGQRFWQTCNISLISGICLRAKANILGTIIQIYASKKGSIWGYFFKSNTFSFDKVTIPDSKFLIQ